VSAGAVERITLQGRHVRLEPLSLAHLDDLCDVGLDESLWRWTVADVRTREDLRAYCETALAEEARGESLPFTLIECASSRAVGSTRFGNIALAHGRVEIGWTWVAAAWQRTAINTEAKLLLLTHAFEALGCTRVELKTDALNVKSRAAILRIGATEEGTLRRHTRTARGRIRDTVYFSILDNEWPRVRAGLEERLAT
jgi:N-acetyltransferase